MLWQPSASDIAESNLSHYFAWLKAHKNLDFQDYDALWAWSVDNIADFWASLVAYFDIQFHTPYTQVVSDDVMPNARWFEGATLNYAEHVFRNATTDFPAILYQSESGVLQEMSWEALSQKVKALQHWLQAQGIQKGDRVVGYLPNIPEATIALLATVSLGAVWSSASPDFGAESVIERFQQIEPKVLIAVQGYAYNGKAFDKSETVSHIINALPSLQKIAIITPKKPLNENEVHLDDLLLVKPATPLSFVHVSFSDPMWVLYSSGTTGKPKAITHSQGGILLEHLKYLIFHNDLKRGEKFFWYSTTGWMMWNFVQSTLLANGTIVLYDGSPSFPDLNALWQFAATSGLQHFGTSAPFVLACMKAGISPKKEYDVSQIRTINVTGAPLPPEGFAWLHEHVSEKASIISMSGGTDLCTAFVGGVPILPVYEGEIQRACLGADIDAFDENGNSIRGEMGEMVIKKPMPSMPIYFWNDAHQEKYHESYFEMFPDIWRHGDWLTITERNTLIISGRSDATLNRNGIRIGTAEIYRVLDQIPSVQDSLIVNIERKDGSHFMPLFVQMKPTFSLTDEIRHEINEALKKAYSPRHVPDAIMETPDIPYTISGKKLEAPVKKLLMGIPLEKAANLGIMRNPEALRFFEKLTFEV